MFCGDVRQLDLDGVGARVGELSPTVFRFQQNRFFFFSRAEARVHVHVSSPDGEAKFWIEPEVRLAVSEGMNTVELHEIQRLIEEREK